MANQHTQALETRAAELAAELYPLHQERSGLLSIADNPICGKPGKGYKAARRANRRISELDAKINETNAKIDAFVFGSSKDPKDRQRKRLEAVERKFREFISLDF